MSCGKPEFVNALDALLNGELSPSQYASLRQHATTCGACRAQYERISQVESHVDRRALPPQRQDLLEGELFARLGLEAPAPKNLIRPARWSVSRVAVRALPIAASLLLAVFVGRRWVAQSEDPFQPRGAGASESFGIRAFCVTSQGVVVGEARPGQTLRCAPGQAVQFSHTSPQAVSLRIVGAGTEPLHFFPAEGGVAQVASGTDVPLSFSTPVQSDWLRAAVPVTATFLGQDGKVLAESRIVIEPAE